MISSNDKKNKREVFLNHLPTYYKGIDWKNTIGYEVEFIYHQVRGKFEILDCFMKNNRSYLTIKYKDNIMDMQANVILRCALGNLIGVFTKKYTYDVGEVVSDVNSGLLQITEQIRIDTKRGSASDKGYKYKCLICDNEDKIKEHSLKIKTGCNVCAGNKVLKGYNDIATTNVRIHSLMWDEEDGYKYSLGSKKKIDWKCPHCNEKIKNKYIYSIVKQGISCPICSDGISYPEKVMYNILSQLNIDFYYQTCFKWSEGRRYDFFIDDFNLIIETHGIQHYSENGRGRTLVEEIKNDEIKKSLAIKNNCKLLVIDCMKSDIDYIKNSVVNSGLSEMLNVNLNNVNWVKIDIDIANTLVKSACELWNADKTMIEISNELKLNRRTILSYLKKGNIIGWCNYDPEEEKRKRGIAAGKSNRKEIVQLSKDGKFINFFNSSVEAGIKLNIKNLSKHVASVCKGKRETASGFRWMYKRDYENIIKGEVV